MPSPYTSQTPRQAPTPSEEERILSLALVIVIITVGGGLIAMSISKIVIEARRRRKEHDAGPPRQPREPLGRTAVAWIVAGAFGLAGSILCIVGLTGDHFHANQRITLGAVALVLGTLVFIAGLFVKK
jgi:uncharacterized iron-regulated membrane protein